MRYKSYKTTMGHKYSMRLCEDEVAERVAFRAVMIFLPLLTIFTMAKVAGLI